MSDKPQHFDTVNKALYRSGLHMQLTEFYLDWINNWLTMKSFAEHHGLPIAETRALVKVGEQLHLANVREYAKLEEA